MKLQLLLCVLWQAASRVSCDRRCAYVVAIPYCEAPALRDRLGLLCARLRVHLRGVPRLLHHRGGARGVYTAPDHYADRNYYFIS